MSDAGYVEQRFLRRHMLMRSADRWRQSGQQSRSWVIRESLAMRVGARRGANLVPVEERRRSCSNEGGQGVGGEANETRVQAGGGPKANLKARNAWTRCKVSTT